MKKVYVLVALSLTAFGAASVGSMSFASVPDDSVPATDDSVPATDAPTTAESTTTVLLPTPGQFSVDPTTIAPGSTDASTTIAGDSSSSVAQLVPTTVSASPTSVGSDGLLPNTGGDIAIPLILAGLAAGTGAATLLVRRRSNAS